MIAAALLFITARPDAENGETTNGMFPRQAAKAPGTAQEQIFHFLIL
jgi:hypothetical protein